LEIERESEASHMTTTGNHRCPSSSHFSPEKAPEWWHPSKTNTRLSH
jgi:hypothetical protein